MTLHKNLRTPVRMLCSGCGRGSCNYRESCNKLTPPRHRHSSIFTVLRRTCFEKQTSAIIRLLSCVKQIFTQSAIMHCLEDIVSLIDMNWNWRAWGNPVYLSNLTPEANKIWSHLPIYIPFLFYNSQKKLQSVPDIWSTFVQAKID